MFILSFFHQIDVYLVTHKQFMASVARVYRGGVKLIAITCHDAMETSPYHKCHGVIGGISHTTIEHLLVISIDKATRNITSPCHTIRTKQH